MPRFPYTKRKKTTKKKASKKKTGKPLPDPKIGFRNVQRVVHDHLQTPFFWDNQEESAFITIMKKKAPYVAFSEPIASDANDPCQASVPARGDAFAGVFNRSDVPKLVRFTMWQTVPGRTETIDMHVDPWSATFFWDGAFPVIGSTTAHACPRLRVDDPSTWSDLFWIGAYVDIETRWQWAHQSQRFPYRESSIQYGRGMIFAYERDGPNVAMRDTDVIECSPMDWTNGPVLVSVSASLTVSNDDHVCVSFSYAQTFA